MISTGKFTSLVGKLIYQLPVFGKYNDVTNPFTMNEHGHHHQPFLVDSLVDWSLFILGHS